MIAAKYPALAANNQKEYDQLRSAFQYLYFARRTPAPNTKVSNDALLSEANTWLAASGRGFAPTTARALVAACIVHGNIPFSEPPWPVLGLAHGARSEMQPTSWRKVLEAGRLPDPTAVPRVLDGSIGMSVHSQAG